MHKSSIIIDEYTHMKQSKVAVVMINWNGEEDSLLCLDALKKQSYSHTVIAVDNGSSDNFSSQIKVNDKNVILIENSKNLGFSGGVNTGIKYAINNNFDYVALINNDALPEKIWLEQLVLKANENPKAGIVTGKLLKTDGLIDSTGDLYTTWGLPYPRGRDTVDEGQYNMSEEVFGASGGASLYRIDTLKQIGMFDEDFFAYYEDVDISFRAQLAGWKVLYQPTAVAHHKVGASSGKIKGFTTYQTVKNLPWLFWKNVPAKLLPTVLPRFFITYNAIIFSALIKGKFIPVFKGLFTTTILLPKKLLERRRIQKSRTISSNYIKIILEHDLPPNATKLRKLRSFFKHS
jgi:GT2 family glycosyltransferase